MSRMLSQIGVLLCALCGLLSIGDYSRSAVAAEPSRALPEVAEELYVEEPVPMSPVECGRCHTHYSSLKQDGGRHRFACQECHEQFHNYNPLKNNYAELMPKCGSCHGEPHGPLQTACAECHADPHAPQRAPAIEQLEAICADCHGGPADKMVKFPSAHAEQDCATCHHDQHGYIPTCFECHDGHHPTQELATCANCHQNVHMPLEIPLHAESDARTCADCHGQVHAKWTNTPSKHGEVGCGTCHESHGAIPACQECHPAPHSPQQLKMFPNCLDCHMDVHDLPVK